MAKRIIILEKIPGRNSYHVLFWLAVPAGRESIYADPEKASAWADASVAENDAIKAGTVLEVSDVVSITENYTIPQVLSYLESQWTTRQASLTNDPAYAKYGSFWDGAAWTSGSK